MRLPGGWPKPQGRGRAGDMPGTAKTAHQAERLLAIRLRYCINTHRNAQRITALPDIARAVGLPPAEAELFGRRRRGGQEPWPPPRGGDHAVGGIAATTGLGVTPRGVCAAVRVGAPTTGLGTGVSAADGAFS